MRRDFVVDASVGIKLFVAEVDTPLADRFFARLAVPSTRFYVPDLFFVECTNILWKYTQRFNYPAKSALQDVEALRALDLRVASAADLIELALSLALQFEVTAYDAVYAALAQKLNAPLVTADERLQHKLKAANVLVLTLPEIPDFE